MNYAPPVSSRLVSSRLVHRFSTVRSVTPRQLAWLLRPLLLVFLLSGTTLVLAQGSFAGTYDDPDTSRISYRGTWQRWGPGRAAGTCDYCMWNTQSLSGGATSDEVDFTFTGSSLTWFSTMASNRGGKSWFIYDSGGNSVDNNFTRDFAQSRDSNIEVRRQVGKTVQMPNYGTYRIIMKGWNGQYDIDSFAVDIQSFGYGVWPQSNAAVRFIGPWHTIGNFRFSNTNRALARLTFEGESVTFVFDTGPDRGWAAISIDGKDYGHVNLYNPNHGRLGKSFLLAAPEPGSVPYDKNRVHIVSISVLGQGGGGSGSWVNLSSIDVGYLGAGYFPKSNLTWKFLGVQSDANGSQIEPARRAMATWSNGTNINLTEVAFNVPSDLTVQVFDQGSEWPPFLFGVAEACGNAGCGGEPSWENMYTQCNVKLHALNVETLNQAEREYVFLHEMGHCLSLHHRNADKGLMYPRFNLVTQLGNADIALVNSRYAP